MLIRYACNPHCFLFCFTHGGSFLRSKQCSKHLHVYSMGGIAQLFNSMIVFSCLVRVVYAFSILGTEICPMYLNVVLLHGQGPKKRHEKPHVSNAHQDVPIWPVKTCGESACELILPWNLANQRLRLVVSPTKLLFLLIFYPSAISIAEGKKGLAKVPWSSTKGSQDGGGTPGGDNEVSDVYFVLTYALCLVDGFRVVCIWSAPLLVKTMWFDKYVSDGLKLKLPPLKVSCPGNHESVKFCIKHTGVHIESVIIQSSFTRGKFEARESKGPHRRYIVDSFRFQRG